jgi:hypothetical protein
MDNYNSSEELQRASREAFVDESAKKKQQQERSEKDRVHAFLDKHISKHSKTSDVRDMAKENDRTAEYQLDLSADIVVLLEKIKNELR